MDLYSGLPYWIVKNKLVNYFTPLDNNVEIEAAIIGSGITGSLVAHELCRAGVPCAIFDKRTITTGSSCASTAQLQYEIDVPLHKLADLIGLEQARGAYFESLYAIDKLEAVFKEVGFDPDFERVPSILVAHNRKGKKLIEKEFSARKNAGLPVEFIDKQTLLTEHSLKGYGALKNNRSAQMDCYKGAVGILEYHIRNSKLEVYTPVNIENYRKTKTGYELITSNGIKIICKYLIIAAGFEAGKFLPKDVMDLNSTYVAISQPVAPEYIWPQKCLYWDTDSPYYYMRTTKDNRMMIGGLDVPFKDPVKRDMLLRRQIQKLESRFKKLYPSIPFVVDMAWCGTFSSTKDGLPYIGAYPGLPNMLFALGYGGNGITFSMIAAEVICNIIQGKRDDRTQLFGFDRNSDK